MRTPRTATTTLLALLAATACAASGASALADTTGATGGASPAPATTKVHKTGIATWFGPGFYGQQTACGQMLTPAVIGVANRTLPCGTLVRVTYRGHALVVPVLDRGPYANHADWDLTAGAAQALNITETVRIGARVVGVAPNTPLLGSPPVTPAEAATGGAQAAG
ncbi:MAG TPA: septal ring lytic transglycosylase RlpA family protein [Solirubrobacteraceae bacterium]|nr:septal ring lytic transglycosylase RlpA family protein [Solirubrobacteraceae bacterium]